MNQISISGTVIKNPRYGVLPSGDAYYKFAILNQDNDIKTCFWIQVKVKSYMMHAMIKDINIGDGCRCKGSIHGQSKGMRIHAEGINVEIKKEAGDGDIS